MERNERYDYEPLRAAARRGDRARVEVEARKLRDQHVADLVVRAATGIRSASAALKRGIMDLARGIGHEARRID